MRVRTPSPARRGLGALTWVTGTATLAALMAATFAGLAAGAARVEGRARTARQLDEACQDALQEATAALVRAANDPAAEGELAGLYEHLRGLEPGEILELSWTPDWARWLHEEERLELGTVEVAVALSPGEAPPGVRLGVAALRVRARSQRAGGVARGSEVRKGLALVRPLADQPWELARLSPNHAARFALRPEAP